MSQSNGVSNGAVNGNGTIAKLAEQIGNDHYASSIETPMRPDAFALSDEEKMERIQDHFREIMNIMGLDLKDDSLRGTPRRVAKMFVQEIFSGLNPSNKPKISLFENKFGYRQMLVEKDIEISSFCEHHFLPIYGRAHVAYFANRHVIGLSKLNRIVDFYARRPQVQERLTIQIAEELKRVLRTEDVAVWVDAQHMCVQARGVEHKCSSTITTEYSGKFLNEHIRAEFIQSIKS